MPCRANAFDKHVQHVAWAGLVQFSHKPIIRLVLGPKHGFCTWPCGPTPGKPIPHKWAAFRSELVRTIAEQEIRRYQLNRCFSSLYTYRTAACTLQMRNLSSALNPRLA